MLLAWGLDSSHLPYSGSLLSLCYLTLLLLPCSSAVEKQLSRETQNSSVTLEPRDVALRQAHVAEGQVGAAARMRDSRVEGAQLEAVT